MSSTETYPPGKHVDALEVIGGRTNSQKR